MYLTPYSKIAHEQLVNGKLGLIITPQSHRPRQYDVADFEYWAADNGCFTLGDAFDLDAYIEFLQSFSVEQKRQALFATAPDVVGDWTATLDRSLPALPKIRAAGFPVAIVLQDGATVDSVPFDSIDAVFVGGTTEWKLGTEAAAIVAEAARRGKWTHMGRVNGGKRFKHSAEIGCFSVDGTYLVFGPKINLPKIERFVESVYADLGDVTVDEDWNLYATERRETVHEKKMLKVGEIIVIGDGLFIVERVTKMSSTVRPLTGKKVTIGDRTFTARGKAREICSEADVERVDAATITDSTGEKKMKKTAKKQSTVQKLYGKHSVSAYCRALGLANRQYKSEASRFLTEDAIFILTHLLGTAPAASVVTISNGLYDGFAGKWGEPADLTKSQIAEARKLRKQRRSEAKLPAPTKQLSKPTPRRRTKKSVERELIATVS